jgi:hypothetical protein
MYRYTLHKAFYKCAFVCEFAKVATKVTACEGGTRIFFCSGPLVDSFWQELSIFLKKLGILLCYHFFHFPSVTEKKENFEVIKFERQLERNRGCQMAYFHTKNPN